MPMKMPKATEPAIATFTALAPSRPDVTVRKMFGQPAAFHRGQMFLGVFGDAVFVRLSVPDRAKAIAEGGRLFEPMPGRAMKEYVVLPAKVLASPTKSKAWIARSLEYAGSLPPK